MNEHLVYEETRSMPGEQERRKKEEQKNEEYEGKGSW
jgi:hypothetical protein